MLRDKCLFSLQELICIAFLGLHLYGKISCVCRGCRALKMFWTPLEWNSSVKGVLVNPEVLVTVFKLTASHIAWLYSRSEILRPGVLQKRDKVQSPIVLSVSCYFLLWTCTLTWPVIVKVIILNCPWTGEGVGMIPANLSPWLEKQSPAPAPTCVKSRTFYHQPRRSQFGILSPKGRVGFYNIFFSTSEINTIFLCQ